MKIKHGTTRSVILLGKYAFKIPILNRSLKHFVKGWIGNIDERNTWNEFPNDKLCPVYFSVFGLINVMPKTQPVNESTYKFDKQWALTYFKDCNIHIDVCSGWKNFGYIGKSQTPVIIDYAICRESNEYCSDCDDDCILKQS